MLLKNQQEVEKVIKVIVIKAIKLYKGKGPDYVNVKVTGKEIEICAKGVVSKIGKLLIEHDGIELVDSAFKKLQNVFHKYLIEEILKETSLKCEVVLEENDYKEDFRRSILKIENMG